MPVVPLLVPAACSVPGVDASVAAAFPACPGDPEVAPAVL